LCANCLALYAFSCWICPEMLFKHARPRFCFAFCHGHPLRRRWRRLRCSFFATASAASGIEGQGATPTCWIYSLNVILERIWKINRFWISVVFQRRSAIIRFRIICCTAQNRICWFQIWSLSNWVDQHQIWCLDKNAKS
jgi:hypothetical protein